jgi:hypothetical protein
MRQERSRIERDVFVEAIPIEGVEGIYSMKRLSEMFQTDSCLAISSGTEVISAPAIDRSLRLETKNRVLILIGIEYVKKITPVSNHRQRRWLLTDQ